MKHDYQFFKTHMDRLWTFAGWNLAACVEGDLITFFQDVGEAQNQHEVVEKSPDIIQSDVKDVVRVRGAYSKRGASVLPLEQSLKTKPPEDFTEFYETFGECLVYTRGLPVTIHPLEKIIEDFEDDCDGEMEGGGRFFRFAEYDGFDVSLGLRRDDQTDAWQVVMCTYGLLYSEMIGPQGHEHVVAPSFYNWIKHLIETNGYPDECAPRDVGMPYLTVIEKN